MFTRALLKWVLLVIPLGTMVPGAASAAGIGFRNDLKIPVIVQGASEIKGMIFRGQPLLIQPTKMAWDTNLPPGIRYISIHEASQPFRKIFEIQIPFQNNDRFFAITVSPVNPNLIILREEPVPKPGFGGP